MVRRGAGTASGSSMFVTNTIICGDALAVLKTMPSESIQTVCTSPPYWQQRDYHTPGQLGLEPSYHAYITRLCDMFDEIRRVLRPDGTVWVNLADTYSGNGSRHQAPKISNKKAARFDATRPGVPRTDLPRKSLCLIPSRFAIEMVRRGWLLRNVLIWKKPNVTPESVKDRFTIDFEYLFFFAKSPRYYFEQQFEPAVYEAGLRNKRCIWTITTTPYLGNHFAAYPEKLVETPIRASCPEGGLVLDPFSGTGTTAVVAQKLGRRWLGIELNPAYCTMARQRLWAVLNGQYMKKEVVWSNNQTATKI